MQLVKTVPFAIWVLKTQSRWFLQNKCMYEGLLLILPTWEAYLFTYDTNL